MGKFFKDSYASTYAARNVKEALDKLIDVLQSPAQVRKLVIGAAPRKPGIKLPGKLAFESPANTPLWMETSASVASKKHANHGDTIVPSSRGNPTERKKTTSSSSGSRASETSECGDSNLNHIPVGRFTQVTSFRYISFHLHSLPIVQ